MNKLDLDISKYSSDELCEIFNIQPNIKPNDIQDHMSSFRNTIISDNNMNIVEKDNVSKFIDKVVNKIIESLDKTKFDISNTFSAPQNNLVIGSSIDHPIIENPNLQSGLDAKVYEGSNVGNHTYPPGYINPINIKTTKRQINIDSRFRSAYYNSLSSNFHYDLPDTFKKVVNMRITSFNIPLSIYSVNSSNNCFTVDTSNIDISYGNYSTPFTTKNTSTVDSSGSIVININNELNNEVLSDINYSIDVITGKSILTAAAAAGPYTIYFNKDCSGADDFTTPLPLKLGWMLGFRAGVYTLPVGGTLVSEGILSIESPRYLYLCVNDYTNAGGNNFVALYNESTISPYIMGRIQYQELIQKSGIFNYGQDDDTFEATREYFGPVDIQKLNLQILDEYGRVVDFNNMDWSCTITFEVLYD